MQNMQNMQNMQYMYNMENMQNVPFFNQDASILHLRGCKIKKKMWAYLLGAVYLKLILDCKFSGIHLNNGFYAQVGQALYDWKRVEWPCLNQLGAHWLWASSPLPKKDMVLLGTGGACKMDEFLEKFQRKGILKCPLQSVSSFDFSPLNCSNNIPLTLKLPFCINFMLQKSHVKSSQNLQYKFFGLRMPPTPFWNFFKNSSSLVALPFL